jgi:formyltetrahydrofolate synthetase
MLNTRERFHAICRFLYKLDQPIKGKIEAIAASYGAASVEYSAEAEAQIERYTKQGFDTLPICIAKTQYSFSADASAKGAPSGFSLPVREVGHRASFAGRD